MTVINAMKFNAEEGGMVTDSQSTNGMRKYDFTDKVVPIKIGDTYALVGGSGGSDIFLEATSILTQYVANAAVKGETCTVNKISDVLSKIMIEIKLRRIDSFLKSTYGIDAQTAISGQGVGAHLLSDIKEVLTANTPGMKEAFNNQYLVIGKDKENIGLYSIYMGFLPNPISHPYSVSGSGADESDKVLRSFVKDQSREERKNISLVSGMAALIRATNASSEVNQGVGGTPTISYFEKKGITILGEEESKLATEVVKVRDAELISPTVAEGGLGALLHGTGSVDEVEQKTFKQTSLQYDQIMRYLRGYRV